MQTNINQYDSNGRAHGLWVNIVNGRVTYKGHYKNGILDGRWECYRRNGGLDCVNTFKDGVWHGPQISYHSNGKLHYHKNYINGSVYGLQEYRDMYGNLTACTFIAN